MLLTRQQAKAQKRNAKWLGQLLQDARKELEFSSSTLEETALEQGSWEKAELSRTQDAYQVLGQLLALADQWHQLNRFEIEEKLSQIEQRGEPN